MLGVLILLTTEHLLATEHPCPTEHVMIGRTPSAPSGLFDWLAALCGVKCDLGHDSNIKSVENWNSFILGKRHRIPVISLSWYTIQNITL